MKKGFQGSPESRNEKHQRLRLSTAGMDLQSAPESMTQRHPSLISSLVKASVSRIFTIFLYRSEVIQKFHLNHLHCKTKTFPNHFRKALFLIECLPAYSGRTRFHQTSRKDPPGSFPQSFWLLHPGRRSFLRFHHR